MTLVIQPLEQVSAEIATVISIDVGAKDAADKYSRAQVALQVASAVSELGTGNVAQFAATAQAALMAKITDPGQLKLVTDLFAVAQAFITPIALGAAAVPLLSATADAIANNIATGITNVAKLYPAPAAATAPALPTTAA